MGGVSQGGEHCTDLGHRGRSRRILIRSSFLYFFIDVDFYGLPSPDEHSAMSWGVLPIPRRVCQHLKHSLSLLLTSGMSITHHMMVTQQRLPAWRDSCVADIRALA